MMIRRSVPEAALVAVVLVWPRASAPARRSGRFAHGTCRFVASGVCGVTLYQLGFVLGLDQDAAIFELATDRQCATFHYRATHAARRALVVAGLDGLLSVLAFQEPFDVLKLTGGASIDTDGHALGEGVGAAVAEAAVRVDRHAGWTSRNGAARTKRRRP